MQHESPGERCIGKKLDVSFEQRGNDVIVYESQDRVCGRDTVAVNDLTFAQTLN